MLYNKPTRHVLLLSIYQSCPQEARRKGRIICPLAVPTQEAQHLITQSGGYQMFTRSEALGSQDRAKPRHSPTHKSCFPGQQGRQTGKHTAMQPAERRQMTLEEASTRCQQAQMPSPTFSLTSPGLQVRRQACSNQEIPLTSQKVGREFSRQRNQSWVNK